MPKRSSRGADCGYGRIVNVASTTGHHSSTFDPVYGATKTAELFPQNRIADSSENANAIRFLVSKTYDSGKVIEVAGGRYL